MTTREVQIEEARQLYLFGAPGSIAPVRAVLDLATRTGLSATTINQMLPVWNAELRARAGALSSIYGNAADADVMQDHADDMSVLRLQLTLARNAIAVELKNAGDDLQSPRYLNAVENFVNLKKVWDKLQGVTMATSLAGEAHRLVIEDMIKNAPKNMRLASGQDVTEDPAFSDEGTIDIDP